MFWPLPETRLFQNSPGFGFDSKEVMQRHARESEIDREKGVVRRMDGGHVEKGRK